MSKIQDVQDWLRKYLFWCLCGLIALFSLTAWWFGVGTLSAKSKENLTKIQGSFDEATKITQVVVEGNIHPNDAVNTQLSKLTLSTRETVLKSWKALYDRQQATIFKWPAILDQEFLGWITTNPHDAEIPPNQLVEYQNKVLKELERIVTEVANAEWPDNVAAAAAAASTSGNTFSAPVRGGEEAGGALPGIGVPGVSEKLLWDPADITAYKNRYKWGLRPSSSEVRLAQEDLWLLEQLCRVITTVNGKTPPYLRPIKVVKKIAIEGYALDGTVNGQPNAINSNRIYRPAGTGPTAAAPTAEAGGEEGAPAEGAAPEGTPVIGNAPARLGNSFSGGIDPSAAPVPDEEGSAPVENVGPVARKPEDDLYEWRYVDQQGYPLSKAQLDGDHKTDMYRMIPFKIQMHIVQASLPKLLETFKNAPLTMEINQIRINPDNNAVNLFANLSKTAGADGNFSSGGSGATDGSTAGLLPGEIVLEIHGVAYLATPYDETKLPPPDGAAADPDAT